MKDVDDRDLEELFDTAHRQLDPPAPDFWRLWRAAGAKARADRGERRVLPFKLGLLVAAVLLLAVLLPLSVGRPRRVFDEGDALRFAHSLGQWRESTAFLGQPPGFEILRTTPSLTFSSLGPSPSPSPSPMPAELSVTP